MKCPNCGVSLLMTERKGVEVDYCGQCRGVWLDRGELDKIIDLSVAERFNGHSAQRDHVYDNRSFGNKPHYKKHRDYAYDRGGYPRPKYKKKKSLMGEIFDIFD